MYPTRWYPIATAVATPAVVAAGAAGAATVSAIAAVAANFATGPAGVAASVVWRWPHCLVLCSMPMQQPPQCRAGVLPGLGIWHKMLWGVRVAAGQCNLLPIGWLSCCTALLLAAAFPASTPTGLRSLDCCIHPSKQSDD